ncbi:MAG: glycosyltransferase [Pelatocladus maniniholoensis HA4357-MV3]|jgi:glycosyltransferase involved in cell wall biosynthesis|uniref:Glycosyltransferase n=1 Tax=Pelatocladus maniniholoensis HA4357-MV3 TaxID=1117104 RepID=A0A9E3H7Z5_9NOST|nr:glycosyltransferase [Pelatocladus maniniholoensis HA4357-MV3]BAZ68343.1 glycosyl transferase family protein [Fischerella sp. NIES-4106]
MLPKISVVMSVYNGGQYLQESIESILNQTFTNFEFIVIDDGSIDSSWEILTRYAKEDQRIKLFKNEENLGLTKSLNKGLKLAQGEYIARQDADDVSLPERFEKQVKFLDQSPEVVLVSCNIEWIDPEGRFLGKQPRDCDRDLVAWYLLFYNHLAGHSQVMFRQKPVRNLGGYCENYRYSQDYELWSRLIQVSDIVILSDALLQQRRHDKSISSAKKLDQDTYSLTNSKRNIKQLLGEELSLEEVDELRGFWLGHWCSSLFPSSQNVSSINSRLKEIYQVFVLQSAQHNRCNSDLSLRLRVRIAQQFGFWIRSLSIRRELISKFQISLYVLVWYPPALLDCWLKEIKRLFAIA